MTEKTKKNLSGFTLLELVVAMAILSIMTTATITSMNGNKTRQEVQSAARLIAATIREGQNYAVTGKNITANANARPCKFRVQTVSATSSVRIQQMNAGMTLCPQPGSTVSAWSLPGISYTLPSGVWVMQNLVKFDVPRGEPTDLSGAELDGDTGPVGFLVIKNGMWAWVCVYPLGRVEEKPIGQGC